jgi:excisionase family DNA binding protein
MTRRISKVSERSGTGPLGRSMKRLRTVDETAEILNVSTRTVRRLIGSGTLSVHRFGRLVRISDTAIAALLAENCSD